MSFENLRIFREVKLVDLDVVRIRNSEKVTAVRKFYFSAILNLNVFEAQKFLLKQIHHSDSFVETNNNVEARRVECDTVRFFFEQLINLQVKPILSRVRPDFHCLVHTCGGNVWLFYAGVHAVDAASMEWQHKVAVVHFVGWSLHVNVKLDDLLVVSRKNQSVFCRIEINTLNLRFS